MAIFREEAAIEIVAPRRKTRGLLLSRIRCATVDSGYLQSPSRFALYFMFMVIPSVSILLFPS